jgi:hypothetical protein
MPDSRYRKGTTMDADKTERRRLRAARFGHLMDRLDGDWMVPARAEQAARWIYVRLRI